MKKILALSCLVALSGLFSVSESLAIRPPCFCQNKDGKFGVFGGNLGHIETTSEKDNNAYCAKSCADKGREQYQVTNAKKPEPTKTNWKDV